MIDVTPPALALQRLGVEYRVLGAARRVLHDIDLEIRRGESYGLVGESGCGKSTVAFAVLRYLPRNGSVSSGRILINGTDLLALDGDRLREMRRKTLAMVYQDPAKALNPSLCIGRQVEEVYELAGVVRNERPRRAADMEETQWGRRVPSVVADIGK